MKEHLKKPAVRSKSEAGGRVALVQNMLHSVQVMEMIMSQTINKVLHHNNP